MFWKYLLLIVFPGSANPFTWTLERRNKGKSKWNALWKQSSVCLGVCLCAKQTSQCCQSQQVSPQYQLLAVWLHFCRQMIEFKAQLDSICQNFPVGHFVSSNFLTVLRYLCSTLFNFMLPRGKYCAFYSATFFSHITLLCRVRNVRNYKPLVN